MRVRCIGYNRGQSAEFVLERPPRIVEYVMLVLRSRTFFSFDGGRTCAPPGSVLIYDKTTPQHFGADGEPFLHDWITFDLTESERRDVLAAGVRFDEVMNVRDVSVLSELIKTVQHEIYSGNAAAKQTADLYLHILLLKLAEQATFSGSDTGRYHAELGRLRAEIYANPKQKRSAREMAESLNISVSYFQHLYKQQFGTAPGADVINSRIEYAKELLSSTGYTVKMIADELDYPSDVQFIQQFKSVTGQTPKSYRGNTDKA